MREVRKQAAKMPAQIAVQTHSILRHPKEETINPPMVGPIITDALDKSIYKEKPFAILSLGNSVAI